MECLAFKQNKGKSNNKNASLLQRNENICPHKICRQTFIAALFVRAKVEITQMSIIWLIDK